MSGKPDGLLKYGFSQPYTRNLSGNIAGSSSTTQQDDNSATEQASV